MNDVIQIIKEKSADQQQRFDAILTIVDHFEEEYFAIFETILSDESDDPGVRSAIALALGKVGQTRYKKREKIFPILASHAADDDVTVKCYSLQALGMLGSIEAAPILVDALKDKNNLVFASAADALGELGRPAVPYLIEVLENGADDARCIACWKLGEIGDIAAVEPMIEIIQASENVELQALAIWGLGEIGHSTPEVQHILDWGKSQEEPDVRLRALAASKKIAMFLN